MEFVGLVLILGALVLLLGPRLMARRGPRADMVPGTLLVTGVSPRPDAPGEQFVTITGVITGPNVNEHVVYQRMGIDTADTANWPTIGQLIPVVYAPTNPDKWFFAPAQEPLA